MRIAFFSDNFYPEISGISDSIVVLGKELARRGHYVDFYAPRSGRREFAVAGLVPHEIELGPRTRVIRFASLPYPTGTGQGRLVIPIGLRAIGIARSRPDIIHSQLFFGTGIEGLFASRLLHIPIIGTNHTVLKEYLKYAPIRAPWFTSLALGYMNWYYRHCDAITAPSPSVLDAMHAAGFAHAAPEEIIPNPIDGDIFKPLEGDRETLKKSFGFKGGLVVYAGRFAAEKKIDVLLRAIASAVRNGTEVTLALAGHGAVQGELERLIQELELEKSVRFMGTLGKEDLARLYRAADAGVSASTSEVQSITMLSSMACGLPFVGVDAPGVAEHIKDNGLLAKADDPEDLGRVITRIVTDPALQKRLGAGAIASVEPFSAARIADRWEAVYAEAIKNYNKKQ